MTFISKKFISILILISMALSFSLVLASCGESVTDEDGYTLYEDVGYGNNERHKLDLCVPDGAAGEVGLILFIHGGGWTEGDKALYRQHVTRWAKDNGYITAALNYRYASDTVHADEILDDITAALTKIKSRAAEMSISTEKVMLVGHSAGGHLATLYAYKVGDDAPIKPAAVVSQSGLTNLADSNYFGANRVANDMTKVFTKISGFTVDKDNIAEAITPLRSVSPLSYVSKSSAPTIICHGTNDDIVPLSNAYALEASLDEAGVKNTVIIYQNTGHDLQGDTSAAELFERTMLEYAREYLAAK